MGFNLGVRGVRRVFYLGGGTAAVRLVQAYFSEIVGGVPSPFPRRGCALCPPGCGGSALVVGGFAGVWLGTGGVSCSGVLPVYAWRKRALRRGAYPAPDR